MTYRKKNWNDQSSDPAGIDPAISWSPVGRASDWAIEASEKKVLYKRKEIAPYWEKILLY